MRLAVLNKLCDKWSGFSDEYLVGEDGYLYRLKDDGTLKRLKSGDYRGGKRYGYQQVRGYFGTGKQHTVKVHRAVALAFVPRPFNTTDVDHINNNKADNRAENLQWLTHRENLIKRFKDARLCCGFCTTCIGVSMGDSEKLLLPLLLIAIGAVLMLWHNDEM